MLTDPGAHRLPIGQISSSTIKLIQYGHQHLTWTAADIATHLGITKAQAALKVQDMKRQGRVKTVSRGVYRLTGVV